MSDMWSYRDTAWSEGEVVGYDVEAVDGSIGKVDEATTETSRAHLVVDTGPWIFGKKRLIPAGAVTGVDHDDRKVVVSLSKDQIKSAPDYEKWDEDVQTRHADHYGPYTAE